MINISILLNQMIVLFLIICTGYIAYKLDYLDSASTKKLNKLVINITLPATILNSVLTMEQKPSGSTVIQIFVISLCIYIFTPVICFALIKLIRIPRHLQGLYTFMLIFSNVGFMGLPIIQAAFSGAESSTAVFYSAILNIIFNCSTFTYGSVLIGYGSSAKTELRLKNLISPGVICSLLSILIYVADVSLPSPITSTIGALSSITTPMAMLLIGATMASMDIKEIFSDRIIYRFSFVKLIVFPIIYYPLLRFFISDPLIRNVFFIELIMPVANTSLIFATDYDLDAKSASKGIFITTLLSIITIPLYLILIGHLG